MLEAVIQTQDKKEQSVTPKGGYRGFFYTLFALENTNTLPRVKRSVLTPDQQKTIERVNKISPHQADWVRREFERQTTDVSLGDSALQLLHIVATLTGTVKKCICSFRILGLQKRADERKSHGIE